MVDGCRARRKLAEQAVLGDPTDLAGVADLVDPAEGEARGSFGPGNSRSPGLSAYADCP